MSPALAVTYVSGSAPFPPLARSPMSDGPSVTDQLKNAARYAEGRFDSVKRSLKAAVGFRRPLRIQTYRGYGGEYDVRVMGRVLEDKPVPEPNRDDPWWRNLHAMYHRWQTDEVPDCRVAAELLGERQTALTDEEGYFEFRFRPDRPFSGGQWHAVNLSLPPQAIRQPGPVSATADVLVPAPDAEFGLISDMDDTVIRSHATNAWKIARLTLLKNARTRLPFEGVSAFYRALAGGFAEPDGGAGDPPHAPRNPVFYVSSSAWNLYELFRDFLHVNNLPDGPILLRDMGLDERMFVHDGHGHKLHKIEAIFETLPDLPFVLIGDSGQDDPKLYREAVQKHPGRVRAIYIRDVRARTRYDVRRIAAEVTALGVPMELVPDTVAAANHAAQLGLIPRSAVAAVREDRRADRPAAAERQEAV